MRRQNRGYMQGFETTASAATIWRALTEPESLLRWLAAEAIVEPRNGGRYATVSRLFGRREARIERFDAGARLQLMYEPTVDWPSMPDSALVEDFIIDERKGQRMLRVMGSGVSPEEEWAKTLVRLRTAWALAFAQLQMRLRDGSIGEPPA
ncbi:MAG TPA: SRPBCC domain-containing protein [Steroidobacteraceae bacterium]